MSSIAQVEYYKNNHVKCYYIDSDGDEVIVSDEEDFEVALDYAKAKGEGKVLFCPTKSIQESTEVGHKEKKQKSDALNMVAETVSVDENEDFDSSSSSDSDIEEIDDKAQLVKNEEKKEDFNKIQETVSRDNSIYTNSADLNSLNQSSPGFGRAESEFDLESVEDKLVKAVSSSDVESDLKLQSDDDEIINQFDVIQSQINQSVYNRVADYVEKNTESVSAEINELEAENQEENHSDQKQRNSHFDEDRKQRESNEELELLKMNKSVIGGQEHNQAIPAEKIQNAEVQLNPAVEVAQPQEVIEQVVEEVIEEVKQEEDFVPIQRENVAVSIAKAEIIKDDRDKRINFMNRALENINFVFGDPEKRQAIAQVDESESEKSQEYVLACKPGNVVKKRWRVVNNSNIAWPKKTKIVCQNEKVEADIPKIKNALSPGDKVEISINIKIKEDETENKVEVYVFRFWNKFYGYFGEPLIATIEITPDFEFKKMEDLMQEDKLKELLEGDEINPIYYEMASDLSEEGLGSFEECLKALLQCKESYEEAREALQKKNENKE